MTRMRGSTRRLLPSLVLLCALAAVPYLAFLDGYFLADDLMIDYFLLEDGGLSPAKVFYHFFPRDGYVQRQIYRPFDFVTLTADWWFWGTNPVGYHLSNLGFHLACTLLVFFLIRRIGRSIDLGPAVLGGALFALHPLAPEAVQWIVGRVDLTSCFFTLLALLLFVRYRQTDRGWFLAGTLGATVMGLLSKDVVVVVPLYFVIYDICLGRPFRRWRTVRWNLLAPHFYAAGLVVAYFAFRVACFGSLFGKYESEGERFGAGLASRGWEDVSRVFSLLETMLFPLRKASYAAPERNAVWICLLLGYLALIGLAVAHGLLRGSRPIRRAALFGILWLGATLAPLVYLLRLLPVNANHLNARLAYLPLAALCVGLPLVLFSSEPWRERSWVRARLAIGAVIPLVFIPLAFTHAGLFHQAGVAVRRLQAQVLERYQQVPPGTPVLIENPPLEMDGVYALRTGLPYLLEPPLAPIQVPTVALSLSSPAELGRLLEKHRSRPLILFWNRASGRIRAVTRPDPVALPAWKGSELECFGVSGGTVRPGGQGLRVTRAVGAGALVVSTPRLHVPPGEVDCLVVDFRVEGPGAPSGDSHDGNGVGALRVRVEVENARKDSYAFDVAVGPPLTAGRHRRVVPFRLVPGTYGRGRCQDFVGVRRFRRVDLIFPASVETTEIQAVRFRTGFPSISLTTPEPGQNVRQGPGAAGFGFHALDDLRYYRLVIDLQGIRGATDPTSSLRPDSGSSVSGASPGLPGHGVHTARFDAWRLNRGTPTQPGQLLIKPLDATGNLSPHDFAVDLRHAPPNPEGDRLFFTWKIQALLDPDRPWIVVAESKIRSSFIR
jgi:hypothetical protein